MNLAIISGSHRSQSQSNRISDVLADRVQTLSLSESIEVLSLAGNPLPHWDESIWAGDKVWKETLAPWKQKLKQADAFVVVTPEWGGMVPSGLKNFFLLFGTAELGHKPALITSISSGQGGSYPVTELRNSSYKNCRICYLPDHLIIRHVETALTGEDTKADDHLKSRIDYSLKLLKRILQWIKVSTRKWCH